MHVGLARFENVNRPRSLVDPRNRAGAGDHRHDRQSLDERANEGVFVAALITTPSTVAGSCWRTECEKRQDDRQSLDVDRST